ncbi:ATPase AAA+ type core [Macrophomina phaseolina MS6]|uniref:ATPase AAA+ type core n=1 Tax=Macrophomina phaseolina (strain MS6) TaxID=1126212 RepID=K2RHX5_MACPH|nr:ATPase AAA+ type core [Macrophomina phaseolina MS6]
MESDTTSTPSKGGKVDRVVKAFEDGCASPLCHSIAGLVWGLLAGYMLLKSYWAALETLILAHYACTLTIHSGERIGDDVVEWMSKNLELDSNVFEIHYSRAPEEERANIQLKPGLGTHTFRYGGTWLRISRSRIKVGEREGGKIGLAKEVLKISSFGRGNSVLQAFLEECRDFASNQVGKLTHIYRTSPQARGRWDSPTSRVSRPMSTIDIDEAVKKNLLEDARRYFHVSARNFYANRGIPHRRGYLFYGPPGCGKSSISQAMAGHFRIPIFTVSLASSDMTDDVLEQLFDGVADRCDPPKCIVLLEDIDSAGISREKMRAARARRRQRGVTLSGLLNIIDGVAALEGRLLIMTSNTPDTLDAALVRPGRIDKQVYFGPVTHAVAASIFARMFTVGPDEQFDYEQSARQQQQQQPDCGLPALASAFGAVVPEKLVTPAETQCYLLEHRDDPVAAVERAADWVARLVEAKTKGTSVSEPTPVGAGAQAAGGAGEGGEGKGDDDDDDDNDHP